METTNKLGIDFKASPYVGTLLGKHAIGKPSDKMKKEDGAPHWTGEEVTLLSESDFNKRWNRASSVDQECQALFERSIMENATDKWKSMLLVEGETELMSLPIAAMQGAPVDSADTPILGDGIVMFTQMADQKHRLIFAMASEGKSFEAVEAWRENKAVTTSSSQGSAKYTVQRMNDQVFGVVNLEGNLFHVHVKTHDEATLKSIFAASQFTDYCGCSCFASCRKNCVSCINDCCKNCIRNQGSRQVGFSQ